ncbi:MAG: hypothetical protein GXO00_01035 [Candidatus Diapherotrites archaeon]|nr:hypothetical protein [Candidatus Diapherotrites archaeon]
MDAAWIVLEHGRCGWGACYFCGWGKREAKTHLEELKEKYLRFLEKNRGKRIVKVFSSGSHLDFNQYPADFVRFLVEKAKEYGFEEIILESLLKYITEESLDAVKIPGIKVTIAVGLEVADDEILNKYLLKGMTVEDYERAGNLLREKGFGLRTYVLVNGHPVLHANPDLQRKLLKRTLEIARRHSDSIVVINAYPHQHSRLMLDWIRGDWRPLDENAFFDLVESVLEELGAQRRKRNLYFLDGVPVELDFSNFAFVPKIPVPLRERIVGASVENLRHPHFEVWQDFFARFYEPPRERDCAFFLPCSYRKPYRRSKTHREVRRHIAGFPFFKRLHWIVVSTPGVVPYEFHHHYPFTHYDWPEREETPELMEEYKKVIKERVKRYLERHGDHYKRFIAYFHCSSETLEAIREAFRELGMEDQLIVVLDEEDCNRIREDLGKERLGSSMIRHPLAIQKLKDVLKKHCA